MTTKIKQVQTIRSGNMIRLFNTCNWNNIIKIIWTAIVRVQLIEMQQGTDNRNMVYQYH
jgi:hypothetical protein